MQTPLPVSLLGLALLAAASPMPASAAPSYDACTGFITSLPAVISTQGTWCLDGDLSTAITSGNAIEVANNNVTIDCNGFKIGGLAAGAGTTTRGIRANARLNTTVRDCNLRGFHTAIEIGGAPSAGHLVEGNRVEGSTVTGINVNGAGSQVRSNRVLDTGLSTVTTGQSFAILVLGAVDVVDNSVEGVTAVANASGNVSTRGIQVLSATGAQVAGNRVRGLVRLGDGSSVGINVVTSTRSDVRDNFVLGPGTAGIACSGPDGIYDNHVNGFDTNLALCPDQGNVLVDP
jgi:hypothetical protein